MKCCQCANVAIFGYPADQGDIPLCLNCALKYQALLDAQAENIERHINFLEESIERTVGIPGLAQRFPPRSPRAVLGGPVTLHHVNVTGSNVGVVNTGTIGTIDNAVGALKDEGKQGAAEAITKLTEAVAAAPDLSPDDKQKVLEALSVISAEAIAPPEARRKSTVMTLLKDVAVVVGTSKTLVDLGEKLVPLIAALFA